MNFLRAIDRPASFFQPISILTMLIISDFFNVTKRFQYKVVLRFVSLGDSGL